MVVGRPDGVDLDEVDGLQPGIQVGAYILGSMIGEGAMGVVYRAADEAGHPVAVKFVRRALAADAKLLKRFSREARTGSRVVHPHVVPVLETGEFRGVPFMVQVFLDGGSLSERIRTESKLLPPEAVRVCTQVALGLNALHRGGIVHRDLKPSNILLDRHGDAHVTDFGLVKVRDASVLTTPGAAIGTAGYMAPEQARNDQVDVQTDVYALGCVAFECLTGRAVFAGRQGMRLVWAHMHDPPPHPVDVEKSVPRRLSDAVLSALEKEPQDRPQRADDYARMLQAALE